MFVAVLVIYFKTGTTSYLILRTFCPLNFSFENFCFLAFFLSFAVKMPLVPFHV
jgi:NADH:ubiquinone oxidoreductase subunit 4 (subunit M)